MDKHIPPYSQIIQPGIYRHYKGGLYQVVCMARLEATVGEAVVYQSLEKGHVWVRELVDFLGEVEVEGGRVKRFTRLKVQPSCLN